MSLPNNRKRGYCTVRLPINETDYSRFVQDNQFAHSYLEALYQQHPELFPTTFGQGYAFNGYTQPSLKMGYHCRRIRLKASQQTLTLAPTFLMPYMSAKTADVEKALFLLRFNVPYWGLSYVFGRNDMYWYRLAQSFGRFSLVGTTIKNPDQLPQHLLADEKHTRLGGDKHYIAMTCADECILGAELTHSASEACLSEAYGVFADEARQLNPFYKPETVNTDGWAATQKAWKSLFKEITLILCFLHAFIKIRDRATKPLRPWFDQAADKVWNAYKAPTKASFSQRLRRLKERVHKEVPDSPMKKHILDLCSKKKRFMSYYDHPLAYRTSNMIDRLMRFVDRACFDSMYFHGTLASGKQRTRSWAILWNFCPSSPATIKKYDGKICPAERLNKKRYADNWLENLLASASMNGCSGYQQNPL